MLSQIQMPEPATETPYSVAIKMPIKGVIFCALQSHYSLLRPTDTARHIKKLKNTLGYFLHAKPSLIVP